jgi:proteasome beta subunit
MGTVIALRDLAKINAVTPNIFLCYSGTLSSAQVLQRMTRYYLDSHAIWSQDSAPPKVAVAAEVIRKLLQSNKEDISAQIIIGGVDDDGNHVHVVMQSGMGIAREFAAAGSGSTYLTSYLDEYYRTGMKLDEAEQWALTAITFATLRDGASGGAIQIVKLRKDGASVKWYGPDKHPIDLSIVKT